MTAEEEEKAKAEKKEREEKRATHEKQKIERILKITFTMNYRTLIDWLLIEEKNGYGREQDL